MAYLPKQWQIVSSNGNYVGQGKINWKEIFLLLFDNDRHKIFVIRNHTVTLFYFHYVWFENFC